MKNRLILNHTQFTKIQFARLAILWVMFWLSCENAGLHQFACAKQDEVVGQSISDALQGSDINAKSEEVLSQPEQGDLNVVVDRDDDTVVPGQSEPRQFTSTHLFQLTLIAAVIIWGYSLVMSGKHGTGWLVLATIFGIFAYFARLIKSIFQEVTSSNEVGDWDDE